MTSALPLLAFDLRGIGVVARVATPTWSVQCGG